MLPPGIFSRRSRRSMIRGVRAYFRRRGSHPRWFQSLRMFYRLRMLVMLRMQKRIGAIVRSREAKLHVDGEEAFSRIDELLRSARHTIIIHMFIWLDDPTGRAVALRLVEAADRGVSVHVTKDKRDLGTFLASSEYSCGSAGGTESRKGLHHRWRNDAPRGHEYLQRLPLQLA
ncbi:MAG: hypothetical protein Greene101449_1365 [Candidatus Peregrinibacteria bacterium Greene1014_49]|nr:MAG: hypothetical protein Greene101449_1365 [Candidatus Peregrinibacteria bacterium Greene1014_49]